MKTSLNSQELIVLKKAIKSFFKSRKFEMNKYQNRLPEITTWKELDRLMGFVYTSSSEYAGYFICSVEVYFDIHAIYRVYGFGMDKSGRCFVDLHHRDNGLDTLKVHIN